MSILLHLLRSLLLTGIFSFLAPVLFIGAMLASLSLLGSVPLSAEVGKIGTEQILSFLSVFGSGSPIHGLLLIGTVCSLVGVLFDTCTFYRYQHLRDD